jgi:hypothetical protein
VWNGLRCARTWADVPSSGVRQTHHEHERQAMCPTDFPSPGGGFAQKLKIEHRIDEFISMKIQ